MHITNVTARGDVRPGDVLVMFRGKYSTFKVGMKRRMKPMAIAADSRKGRGYSTIRAIVGQGDWIEPDQSKEDRELIIKTLFPNGVGAY